MTTRLTFNTFALFLYDEKFNYVDLSKVYSLPKPFDTVQWQLKKNWLQQDLVLEVISLRSDEDELQVNIYAQPEQYSITERDHILSKTLCGRSRCLTLRFDAWNKDVKFYGSKRYYMIEVTLPLKFFKTTIGRLQWSHNVINMLKKDDTESIEERRNRIFQEALVSLTEENVSDWQPLKSNELELFDGNKSIASGLLTFDDKLSSYNFQLHYKWCQRVRFHPQEYVSYNDYWSDDMSDEYHSDPMSSYLSSPFDLGPLDFRYRFRLHLFNINRVYKQKASVCLLLSKALPVDVIVELWLYQDDSEKSFGPTVVKLESGCTQVAAPVFPNDWIDEDHIMIIEVRITFPDTFVDDLGKKITSNISKAYDDINHSQKVVLKTGNFVYKAPKLILTSFSRYFSAIFDSKNAFNESNSKIVEFDSKIISSKALEQLLLFCIFATGDEFVSVELDDEIYSTAVYLQVDVVKNLSIARAYRNTDPLKTIKFLMAAHRLNDTHVKNKFLPIIRANLKSTKDYPVWLEIAQLFPELLLEIFYLNNFSNVSKRFEDRCSKGSMVFHAYCISLTENFSTLGYLFEDIELYCAGQELEMGKVVEYARQLVGKCLNPVKAMEAIVVSIKYKDNILTGIICNYVSQHFVEVALLPTWMRFVAMHPKIMGDVLKLMTS